MLGVMIGLMILVQGYGSDKINEDRHSSARTLVVSGQDRQAGEAAFQTSSVEKLSPISDKFPQTRAARSQLPAHPKR
jgi:hypothetical protein